MNTEIEVKFLDVNHDTIRARLTELGAKCLMPMRLMKRAILDFPDRRLEKDTRNSYVRIRDEGDKITLTFKRFKAPSIDGAQEIETVVGSFDDTVKIFESIGLEVKSFQESKRETWMYNDCEVVLDEWPWLKTYIEIEGHSKDALKVLAGKLDLSWDTAVFGDVMVAYRAQYPHLTTRDTVGNVKEVRFVAPPPDFLLQPRL